MSSHVPDRLRAMAMPHDPSAREVELDRRLTELEREVANLKRPPPRPDPTQISVVRWNDAKTAPPKHGHTVLIASIIEEGGPMRIDIGNRTASGQWWVGKFGIDPFVLYWAELPTIYRPFEKS